MTDPKAGEKWREHTDRDSPFTHVRVMAVAEGYVMARYKGCIPFVEIMRSWHERFTPVDPGAVGSPST